MKAIILVEREEILAVIDRLRQLRIAREPNVEMAIAALNDARLWLLREAGRYES